MEIDHEELLQRTYALAKENNKLLKKMRRGAWIGFIIKLIVFVVLPWWMYITFLQPLLGQVVGVFGKVQDTAQNVGITPQQLQQLLHTVPGLDALQKQNR